MLIEYIFRYGSRGKRYVRATSQMTAKATLLYAMFIEREEKQISHLNKEKQLDFLFAKHGDKLKYIGINTAPFRAYPDDLAKAAT